MNVFYLEFLAVVIVGVGVALSSSGGVLLPSAETTLTWLLVGNDGILLVVILAWIMVRTELWFLVELYGLELLDFCLLLVVPTANVAQLHLLQLKLKLKLLFLLLQLSVLPHHVFVEVRIRVHVLHWIKLMRTIVI